MSKRTLKRLRSRIENEEEFSVVTTFTTSDTTTTNTQVYCVYRYHAHWPIFIKETEPETMTVTWFEMGGYKTLSERAAMDALRPHEVVTIKMVSGDMLTIAEHGIAGVAAGING